MNDLSDGWEARGQAGSSPVGALLRDTRLSFGQSLSDVARDIRIRQSFLEAIETGRFAALPGEAYTIGFIRTYAEHLGLEPNEVVRRFKSETGLGAPAAKLNFPSPLAEGGVPKAAMLLVGAVIALVGYGVWYLTSSRYLDVAELALPLPQHLREILPGSPGVGGEAATSLPKVDVPIETRGEPLPPATAPAPAAPPSTPPAASPPAPAAAAPPPVSPAVSPPVSPAAAPSPTSPSPTAPAPAGTAPVASPPSTAPAPAAPAPATAAAAPSDATVPADGASRVLLRATADAWVEVRDPAGRSVLLSRLMKAGESFAVPDRPGLTLLTGNAGGIEAVIDGVAVAPLGRPGTVRRGVPLDAETLRQSLQPVAPAGN